MTNLTLVALTLVGVAASGVALRRLRITMRLATSGGELETNAKAGRPSKRGLNALVVLMGVGAGLLLFYRWRWVGEGGSPLAAHVDGLLLIATLLACVGLYVQSRPRLGGLAAFYLPVLTLLLAWAVCASAWTYRPFAMDTLNPVWRAIHLGGVYLGTLGCAVAAVAGGMYLFVQRQLKNKTNPRSLSRLASLESLERLVQHAAMLGFGLLTLGLISGVVIQQQADALAEGWWHSPKVVLAFAAWALYAVVMNVRVATVFRGRRAAWLAIGGFVLLLGVYGIVTSGGPD
ncbi:MAG: cytochrome c biogenesis protein CcsA [Planctomycetota bacterium]